jgi:hypothetical protein
MIFPWNPGGLSLVCFLVVDDSGSGREKSYAGFRFFYEPLERQLVTREVSL